MQKSTNDSNDSPVKTKQEYIKKLIQKDEKSEANVGSFVRSEHRKEKTDSDIYEDLESYSYDDLVEEKKAKKVAKERSENVEKLKKEKQKQLENAKIQKIITNKTVKKEKVAKVKPEKKKTEKVNQPTKFFSPRTLIEYALFTCCFIFFELIGMVFLGYTISFGYALMFLLTDTILFSLINLIKNGKVRFSIYFFVLTLFFVITIFSMVYLSYKHDGIGLEMLPELRIGLQFTSSESSGAYSPIILFGSVVFFSLIGIFVAFIVGLFFATFKNNRVKNTKLVKIGTIAFYCAFAVVSCIVSNISVPYGNVAYDKYYAYQNIGMLNYFIQDFNGFFYREVVEKNAVHYLEPETKTYSQTTGLCEGKNVIQIMLEEVDDFLITEEMTPNLYALMNDGIKYDNFYSAYSYLSTYDAEYKTLTSGMGYTGSNYYLDFNSNDFNNALPAVLSNAGYTTIGTHNFQGSFFDRDKIWTSMGFDETYFLEDMSYLDAYEYREDWFETFPYPDFPPDSYMFETMQDYYAPTDLDNPFYSFILTVGSHQPFYKYRTVLADYYETIKTTKYENYPEEYKNKLVCAMDLDKGIKAMMDHLTENNMLDDTVIVIYTDHHSYNDEETFEGFRGALSCDYDIFKCPCTIYCPSVLGTSVNSTLTSQYDIVPSVLDLLGISYNTDYYYGQSLFSASRDDRPIIFGATKWIDSVMYEENFTAYVKSGVTMTDEEKTEHYKTVSNFVWKTVKKFNYFLYSDYFKTHTQTVQ